MNMRTHSYKMIAVLALVMMTAAGAVDPVQSAAATR